MLKIPALMDEEDATLTCLGALRPLESEPSRPVALKKKIVLTGMGHYTKELVTPLYDQAVLQRVAVETPGMSFDPTSCIGVVGGAIGNQPLGYVTRTSGGHRFCLPVYNHQQIPASFYSIAGYMLTEDGFVAVAKRRTLFWVILGLLAATTFVLSYMLMQYGAEGAWAILTRYLSGLFPL